METKLKLEFDLARAATEASAPRDAATIIFLREREGLELFCVERAKGSRFLGGAIVFPGGRVDEDDRSDAWEPHATAAAFEELEPDPRVARALGVAACREALEEARLLPTAPEALSDEVLGDLRKASIASVRDTLLASNLKLDLAALVPFGRWVTPIQETRRFDARFFLARAPLGQEGAHDDSETTKSFWATAADLLQRFERGEIELAPPTHRIVELLAGNRSLSEILAKPRSLGIVCPELRPQRDASGETLALTLPGDPEHSVREARVPGRSRFVLRDGRWLPEDAPGSVEKR